MPINWDVNPEIIKLFDAIPIRYYSLLFVSGLLVGLLIVRKLWIQDKWQVTDLDVLKNYIFIGTLAGARLGHCLFYEPEYYLKHPLEIFLPFKIENWSFEFTGFQGLASHGGILAVFIAIWIFSRKSKLNFFAILDKVSIGGAITAVFIRFGNFMNSEIIGKATNSEYGIIFARVDHIVRHPSQLYEAFAYLVIFITLLWAYKNKQHRGEGFVFGLFFTLLFIARFLIEYSKINQVNFEEGMIINMGQVLSIPFILFGISIMAIKYKPLKNRIGDSTM